MSEPSLKKIKKDCEEEIKKCRKKFSIEKDKYEKQKTKYYYFYIKDIQKWLDASTSLTKRIKWIEITDMSKYLIQDIIEHFAEEGYNISIRKENTGSECGYFPETDTYIITLHPFMFRRITKKILEDLLKKCKE